LEINLSPIDVEALQRVAALTGETTLTAVLRDALKAYAWLNRTTEDSYTVALAVKSSLSLLFQRRG
jgi:hypothetical protein